MAAWWRRWRNTTTRGVVSAVLITGVLGAASYGEAHPSQTSDLAAFHGHRVPHTPNAALLRVAGACRVLALKRRYPVTVLAVSTAALGTDSALGYVTGGALLAPAIALFAVAQVVPVRRALALAAVTLLALMAATGAANPFGTTGGGFFLIPALIAAPLFGGIAVANRRAYGNSDVDRAGGKAVGRLGVGRLPISRGPPPLAGPPVAPVHRPVGVPGDQCAATPV